MIKNNFQKLIKLSLFFTLIYTLGCSEKEDTIIEKVSNINGKVTNECGFPIEGALIQFDVYSTLTDEEGNYSLENIIVGEYLITASKETHLPQSITRSFQENESEIFDFVLSLEQGINIQVDEIKGIIGNSVNDVADSIRLKFNKPVKIDEIKSNWEYCLSSIDFKQTFNDCGVSFTFSCAELGGVYPFTIEVSDESGNKLESEISAPFYHKRLDFDGDAQNILDYMFINDDKEILIATQNPSQISRYSLETFSVVDAYDLPPAFITRKLIFNPFDYKIYFVGSTNEEGFLYSLNIQTGEIVEEIKFMPDEDDHPQHPHILPYDIGFTNTEFGIVLLHTAGSSGIRWKIVDISSKQTTNYPFVNGDVTPGSNFNSISPSYDYSKLFLSVPYLSNTIGVFDGETTHISLLKPESGGYGKKIFSDRISDRIYAVELNQQYIIDLDGNMSNIFEFYNLNSYADFSYRKNEENYIYHLNNEFHYPSFGIIDYDLPNYIMKCDILHGFETLKASIDGKYIVSYRNNYEMSSLYIFKTDDFYKYILTP